MASTARQLNQLQSREIEEFRSRTPKMSRQSTSRNFMSRSLTTIHPSQHPTNTSKSKQMFTFGIGPRFKKPRNDGNQQISYIQGSTLVNKQVSFGVGQRSPTMIKKNFDKFPEPGTYNLPSDFEKPKTSLNAGKQFSFGTSRTAYDRVYFKERVPHDRSIPGPGHYNQESKTIKQNCNKSFSMLGRIASESHIAVKVHNPGPGAYEDPNAMKKDGQYLNSTFRNSCVPTFKTPKASQERVIATKPPKDIPGPGQYTPRDSSTTNKYRNCYNLILYRGERNIQLHDKTKLDLPGPQKYTLPSEFGQPPATQTHLMSTTSLKIPKRQHTRKNAALTKTLTRTLLREAGTEMTSPKKYPKSKLARNDSSLEHQPPKTERKIVEGRRSMVIQKSNMSTNQRVTIKRLDRAYKKLDKTQAVPSLETTESARAEILNQLKELQTKQKNSMAKTPQQYEHEMIEQTPSAATVNLSRPKSGIQHTILAKQKKEVGRSIQKKSYQMESETTQSQLNM